MNSDAGIALLGASFVAGVLLLGAPALNVGRKNYLAGVCAAYAAYVAMVPISYWLRISNIELSSAALAVLAPAVEEPVRVATMLLVLSRTDDRGRWLLFGLGYGLLESTLKLTDSIPSIIGEADFTQALALVSVPLVPLLLHIFLALVAMALWSRTNTPTILILILVVALHFFHNWSALALPPPESWRNLLVQVWGRVLLLTTLTYAVSKIFENRSRNRFN